MGTRPAIDRPSIFHLLVDPQYLFFFGKSSESESFEISKFNNNNIFDGWKFSFVHSD